MPEHLYRVRIAVLAAILLAGNAGAAGLARLAPQDSPATQPSPPDPDQPRLADERAALNHLPESVVDGIIGWRERIRSAACIKVVFDIDQTWSRLDRLDETGTPEIARRERLQVHSWMTPDMVWMVAYPYQGDAADSSHPSLQLLWNADSGIVRERMWLPDEKRYLAKRSVSQYPYGADDAEIAGLLTCAYATGFDSWLVGLANAREASEQGPLRTIGFYRSPHLAIIPPTPEADGVWLDVFKASMERDTDPSAEELYRRNDLMLLGRSEQGEPELREWRTIVLTDSAHGGRTPQRIVSTTRFEYRFYESPPEQLLTTVRAFQTRIDGVMEASGSKFQKHPGAD